MLITAALQMVQTVILIIRCKSLVDEVSSMAPPRSLDSYRECASSDLAVTQMRRYAKADLAEKLKLARYSIDKDSVVVTPEFPS